MTDKAVGVRLDVDNDGFRRGFKEASGDVRELGDDLAKTTGEATEDLNALGGEAKQAGLKLGAIGGAAALGGVTASIDSAVVSGGKLRAVLGLSESEAREFDRVAKEVYGDNFGETMDDAALVTAQLYQSLGLTGDALGEAARDVFRISDAFGHLGVDSNMVVESLRTMSAAFPGVDEAHLLDLIAVSLQNGTGNAGDLLDTLQEYAPVFAQLGLDADGAFALLDAGMANGVRNTDLVADAVKELGIRITTTGDTGQVALAEMFPPAEAERLIRDFAAGGESAETAFRKIAEGLVNVEDPQDRYNLAVGLFGTKAEDLATNAGPILAEFLSRTATSTEDVAGATETLDSQYVGFGSTVEGLKRQLETGILAPLGELGPMAGTVVEGFGAIGTAALGFKGIADNLGGITSKLKTAGLVAGGLTAAVGAGVIAYDLATRAGREYDALVEDLAGSLAPVTEGQVALNEALDDFLEKQASGLSNDALVAMGALGLTVADLRQGIVDANEDALDPLRQIVAELGVDLKNLDVGKFDDVAKEDTRLRDVADALGITVDQLRALVEETEDWDNVAQDAAESALRLAVANGDLAQSELDQLLALAGSTEETQNYAGALDILNERKREELEATEAATEGTETGTESLGLFSRATDLVSEALGRESEALRVTAEEHDNLHEAVMAGWSADISYRRSIDQTEDALDTYREALAEAERQGYQNAEANEGLEDATLDAESAILRQAEAGWAAEEALAAQEGRTITADEKTAYFVQQLGWLAEKTEGPVAEAIRNHIGRLDGIPETVNTDVDVTVNIAAGRIAQGIRNAVGDQVLYWAEGGLVSGPTLSVVGEDGPELILPLSKPGRMADLLDDYGDLLPGRQATPDADSTPSAWAATAVTAAPPVDWRDVMASQRGQTPIDYRRLGNEVARALAGVTVRADVDQVGSAIERWNRRGAR